MRPRCRTPSRKVRVRMTQARRHRRTSGRPAPRRTGTSSTGRRGAGAAGRPDRPTRRPGGPAPRWAERRRLHQRHQGAIVDQQPLGADGLHPGADVRRELGDPEGPEDRYHRAAPTPTWPYPAPPPNRQDGTGSPSSPAALPPRIRRSSASSRPSSRTVSSGVRVPSSNGWSAQRHARRRRPRRGGGAGASRRPPCRSRGRR